MNIQTRLFALLFFTLISQATYTAEKKRTGKKILVLREEAAKYVTQKPEGCNILINETSGMVTVFINEKKIQIKPGKTIYLKREDKLIFINGSLPLSITPSQGSYAIVIIRRETTGVLTVTNDIFREGGHTIEAVSGSLDEIHAEILRRTEELLQQQAAGTAQPQAKPSKICAYCGKPSTQKCGRCLTERYCSADCQKSCWPRHKETCIAIEKT